MDKEKIVHFQTPLLIKGGIKEWPALKFSEDVWREIFGDKLLNFRCGLSSFSESPQWERTCTRREMPLSEFFIRSKNSSSKDWFYFDYRNLEEVFPENETIMNAINWASLGFPEVSKKDSTIWIGSKGAHTPCHMDTYGVNLIAQLYGRKQWILMPPEEIEHLQPTRVPYEESSVYSRLNFFSPTTEIVQLKKMHRVILEPGDVLYVPRHWWHYVENLEVAISVNTWIPHEDDDESRLEEALVQRMVVALCQDLTINEAQQVVNPNEDDILTQDPKNDIILAVVSKCKMSRRKTKGKKNADFIEFENNSNIKPISSVSMKEIEELVTEKSKSLNYSLEESLTLETKATDHLRTVTAIINAVCHPEVVSLAKEKLLAEFH